MYPQNVPVSINTETKNPLHILVLGFPRPVSNAFAETLKGLQQTTRLKRQIRSYAKIHSLYSTLDGVSAHLRASTYT
jgi:hypothetical protein